MVFFLVFLGGRLKRNEQNLAKAEEEYSKAHESVKARLGVMEQHWDALMAHLLQEYLRSRALVNHCLQATSEHQRQVRVLGVATLLHFIQLSSLLTCK